MTDPDSLNNIIEGISIPPQPELLISINEELKKADPSLSTIAELVAQDVAISAAVLKTVNSAYFGLRSEVHSIKHAISLLGVPITINLVKGFLLKQAMGDLPHLPRFWDSSESIARSCAFIAKSLGIMDVDPPYTFGLFHNVGIPLMMQKFPEYLQVLAEANQATEGLFTDVEESRLNCNHAILGFILSREWGLPKLMRQALLAHHDVDSVIHADTLSDTYIAKLVSILKIAEMVDSIQRTGNPNNDWIKFKSQILDFLSLSEPDLEDLTHDVIEMLNSG